MSLQREPQSQAKVMKYSIGEMCLIKTTKNVNWMNHYFFFTILAHEDTDTTHFVTGF